MAEFHTSLQDETFVSIPEVWWARMSIPLRELLTGKSNYTWDPSRMSYCVLDTERSTEDRLKSGCSTGVPPSFQQISSNKLNQEQECESEQYVRVYDSRHGCPNCPAYFKKQALVEQRRERLKAMPAKSSRRIPLETPLPVEEIAFEEDKIGDGNEPGDHQDVAEDVPLLPNCGSALFVNDAVSQRQRLEADASWDSTAHLNEKRLHRRRPSKRRSKVGLPFPLMKRGTGRRSTKRIPFQPPSTPQGPGKMDVIVLSD